MQEVCKSHYKTLPRRFANSQRLSSVLSAIVLICIFLFFAALHSESATPAANQKKLYYDLFSVTFPTENYGWACGRSGTILHTVDGGKSWTRQASGIDYILTFIYFVDAKNGWAVGDRGAILHTKDGGTHWEKQKSPVPFFLMGIHFVDSQKGWAVGERTNILHTTDGGRTWKVQFKDQDYILKSVSFCNDRIGWAVGEYGLIYHTENGGANWIKQAGGFGFSEETGEIVGGSFLFNVFAISPKVAWAVGIDGYVAKTIDGGANWQQVEKGVPKVHLFGVVQSGGNVIIAGKTILLTSTDGGITFKSANAIPKVTYGYLYGITPRGKVGFVAVGKAGRIYLTDNKATTWRMVEKR